MGYWEQKIVLRCLTVLAISLSASITGCAGKQQEAALPFYNTPDFTPQFMNAAAADKAVTHHIADFSCTNQYGKAVTQQTVEGKIHVANFFFAACGSICPRMMNNLKATQDVYKNDSNIVFLSFSVMPWADSVPRLKKYAADRDIHSANWHLLTGGKAAIYHLARTSYFAEENFGYAKDSSEFLHTEHILLVDKHKRIRGIYNGTLPLETQQLMRDIALLKAEQ